MKHNLLIAFSAFGLMFVGVVIYFQLTHQKEYVITNIYDGQVLTGDVVMRVSAPQHGGGFLKLWMDGKPHSMTAPSRDPSGEPSYCWLIQTGQFASGRHILGVGYAGPFSDGTKEVPPFDTRNVIFQNPKPAPPGKKR